MRCRRSTRCATRAATTVERERAGGTLVSPRAACRDGGRRAPAARPEPVRRLPLRGRGAASTTSSRPAMSTPTAGSRPATRPSANGERAFEYTARLGDVLRLGGFLVSPSEIEVGRPGTARASRPLRWWRSTGRRAPARSPSSPERSRPRRARPRSTVCAATARPLQGADPDHRPRRVPDDAERQRHEDPEGRAPSPRTRSVAIGNSGCVRIRFATTRFVTIRSDGRLARWPRR